MLKVGRPKNEKARQAILDTAYTMVMSGGVGSLTMEKVAKIAHVGKPRIYREWANTSELAMAAIMSQSEEAIKAPDVTGRKGLIRHLEDVIQAFSNTRGRQIMLVLASTKEENELTSAFRTQVILGSRGIGKTLLQDEIQEGHVKEGIDIERTLDFLYAPIFFQLLTNHQPISPSLAHDTVEIVYSGIGTT